LRAYQLHIGLDALAYTAFVGRWYDVERNSDQVMDLVQQALIERIALAGRPGWIRRRKAAGRVWILDRPLAP
jgi:hypothetical protein